MSAHWEYILAAYGVAAIVILGYRLWLGRQLRAAAAERAALSRQGKDTA